MFFFFFLVQCMLLIFVFGVVNLHMTEEASRPPTSPSSLHLLLSQTQWTSGDFEGTINIPTVFSISWHFWDRVITD